MAVSPRIVFRDIPPSEAVEQAIRQHAESLDRFSPRITNCRVVVEAPHRRRRQGNLFHLRIHLAVPGDEILVSREPALHRSHEDVYVAVRDAFDALRRRLEDYERRRRRQVKAHEPSVRGRIAFLDRAEDYGFIETPEGREIYFHANSIVNGRFDRAEIGDRVRFHEEAGEKGPQASSVFIEETAVTA